LVTFSACGLFGALRHFKFDFLTLFEGLKAVALMALLVNEDIDEPGCS